MSTVHEQSMGNVGTEPTVERLGAMLVRYGLVVVIAWIGLCKFTSFEAQGIQPLVANSPLMSWLYDVFSVNTFSSLLGVVELVTAVLLAVKPWWPRISIAGSVLAIGLFPATISFLVTTPVIRAGNDETALLTALRAGEEAAFADLVDLHTPSMLRVARG